MSWSTTEKKNKAILRHIYALASAAIIIAGLLSFTQSPVLATQTTTSNNNSDAPVQDTLEDARNSTALAQSRVNNIGVGVLAYTHGDMVNEHGTAEMEKMTSIEETLESRFRTPTEISVPICHITGTLDWRNLTSREWSMLSSFIQTCFSRSTVIHNVTRGVFGGIEEYNYCPGVPLSDNGCHSVDRFTTSSVAKRRYSSCICRTGKTWPPITARYICKTSKGSQRQSKKWNSCLDRSWCKIWYKWRCSSRRTHKGGRICRKKNEICRLGGLFTDYRRLAGIAACCQSKKQLMG